MGFFLNTYFWFLSWCCRRNKWKSGK